MRSSISVTAQNLLCYEFAIMSSHTKNFVIRTKYNLQQEHILIQNLSRDEYLRACKYFYYLFEEMCLYNQINEYKLSSILQARKSLKRTGPFH